MTITLRWAACALPLTLALGCKEAASSNPAPTPPTPSKIWPMDPPEAPPSQTELDAKAAKDINEKNADAEFEKLKNEIEGGGGG